MRTCPTAAMDVILDLTPLHLVVQIAAKSAIPIMCTEGIGRGNVLGLESVNLNRAQEQMEVSFFDRAYQINRSGVYSLALRPLKKYHQMFY